jgi:hypothetical protein
MAPSHNSGFLSPGETNYDIPDQTNIAQPYSQNEIEELLYGGDLSVEERLAQLRQLRDDAVTRESGDWGDEDPASMLDEIDRAIEELSGDSSSSDDNYELADVLVDDPENHSHALAPDDVDALRELSGEAEDAPEDADDLR